jgi:hypothetical protein
MNGIKLNHLNSKESVIEFNFNFFFQINLIKESINKKKIRLNFNEKFFFIISVCLNTNYFLFKIELYILKNNQK